MMVSRGYSKKVMDSGKPEIAVRGSKHNFTTNPLLAKYERF